MLIQVGMPSSSASSKRGEPAVLTAAVSRQIAIAPKPATFPANKQFAIAPKPVALVVNRPGTTKKTAVAAKPNDVLGIVSIIMFVKCRHLPLQGTWR